MRAPVAAYGLVVLVCGSSSGVTVAASLGPPIATDFDVFSPAAILLTGLICLPWRLVGLNAGGLGLNGGRNSVPGERENQRTN